MFAIISGICDCLFIENYHIGFFIFDNHYCTQKISEKNPIKYLNRPKFDESVEFQLGIFKCWKKSKLFMSSGILTPGFM